MSDEKTIEDGVGYDLVVRSALSAEQLLSGNTGMITSLDRTNPAHQALMIRALGNADLRSDDVLNSEITVEHILAHNVELVDSASGEVKHTTRIVFITTDGKTIGTCSNGIYKSLQSILSIVGQPPWHLGIRLRIKPVTTRNGYRTLILEFIGINQPTEVKQKGAK